MRLVEMRRGPVVLHFAVLHHQPMTRPRNCSTGSRAPPPRGALVTEEPVEAMLAAARRFEHLIAERQHVRFVAVGTPHGGNCATFRPTTANTARRSLGPFDADANS